MKTAGAGSLFLGLDSSTQGLKAIAIGPDLRGVAEAAVNYDRDLPEFGTAGGVHRDGPVVSAPPEMWAAALDLLLGRMRAGGFAFQRVRAVSGSGQQHGSVYFRKGAREALRKLSPDGTLQAQLAGLFSVRESPVWMDSSTAAQCRERDRALGGAQAVADLTGSRSYERFTGNQIARILETQPEAYAQTERICLVSSYMASLLIGNYAPIDWSDASGMNLMDIRRKAWSPAALDVTAQGLAGRLSDPAPAHSIAGAIHPYFRGKYGFHPDCRVVLFSGDNPCSLAGMRLNRPGDVAVSLGTSDTLFGSLSDPRPSATEGHVFANPVDPDAYMAMIVFQNGSLTREAVRNEWAKGSWERFSELLEAGAPGNGGRIGFYIREPEITPPIAVAGVHRFGPDGKEVARFGAAENVRAVVEGRFLSMSLHGSHVGLEPRAILATGGASANAAIVRILADVFGTAVFTDEQPNSAALGAAYRALHGWRCEREKRFVPFAEAVAGAPEFRKAAEPDMRAHEVYRAMRETYARLEGTIAA